jgi:hypothetical protein
MNSITKGLLLTCYIFQLHAMEFNRDTGQFIDNNIVVAEVPKVGRHLVLKIQNSIRPHSSERDKDIDIFIYENGDWIKGLSAYYNKEDDRISYAGVQNDYSRDQALLKLKIMQTFNFCNSNEKRKELSEKYSGVHKFDKEFRLTITSSGTTFIERFGKDSDLD